MVCLVIFDIYCLAEAAPGSRHFRYFGISFLFVYSGNQHGESELKLEMKSFLRLESCDLLGPLSFGLIAQYVVLFNTFILAAFGNSSEWSTKVIMTCTSKED